MMLYIVIGFLWVSLLIYLLMGGADFGAGILELFARETNKSQVRKTSYQAIGPIWEANHMWVIIAIVILFVGFPDVYTTVSTYLHIPLVVMLMGIIARGTAFAFRNYDAVKDRMQNIYNRIYVYSSFITPLFLGIIAGSAVSRKIDTQGTNFLDVYVYDWYNWFSVAVGFFTVCLCGFLAAIYLIGEVKEIDTKAYYIRKAKIMNTALTVWIIIIFWSAHQDNIPLTTWLFGNWISLATISCSVPAFVLLWVAVYKDKVPLMRSLAGAMIMMLLIAVTYSHYPNIVLFKDGGHLSLIQQEGPDKTITSLGIALLVGSLLILPSLFYLIYSFGKRRVE
ncbi:cytochrome d ubiquinol oxidase subunit II [Mucilaginibacter boryungensis]|nr:cytochrome d ubiquinol oxidase subunit II [Mucilaginibacter boryungensis]